MTVEFRPAQRTNLALLLSLAGGTGSGKTWSAMELAKGIAGGQKFAVCDTERGRASFYADQFDFDVFELGPPFSPGRYLDVIKAAEAGGYPVLIIDSMSHEWEGEGGLIEEHDQIMGGDQAKNLSAWIKPKLAHRKMVNHLIQAKPHVVLCFRAAERVEVVQQGGKTKIVPKKTLTGLDGWVPITEKNLPFEATASFLLMASAPGLPHPIKLPEPLKALVPLERPLSSEAGAALAEWAAGKGKPSQQRSDAAKLTTELLNAAGRLGRRDDVAAAIAKNRHDHASDPGSHVRWLRAQIERADERLAETRDEDAPL